MRAPKRLCLQLFANLSAYEVTIYDETQCFRQNVNTPSTCIRFYSHAPRVHVIARPRVNGYTATLYFHLNTACNNCFSLSFSFPPDLPSTGTSLNTFTLTDRNYGLPIDGTLFFQGS